MKSNFSICIAGQTSAAVSSLLFVADNFGMDDSVKIYALTNKADKGEDGWQPSLLKCARELKNVKIISLSEAEAIPDLYFFSIQFDRIIRPAKFSTTKLFNIHFSLLPKYRGRHTSTLPILYGERESGCTLHFMDSGIDTGPIIAQKKVSIAVTDNSRDLFVKYLGAASELFKEYLPRILTGDFSSVEQPIEGPTYHYGDFVDFKNLKIDFRVTAWQVHNQIRAYSFPGSQLPEIEGKKISRSEITKERSSLSPGKIIELPNGSLRISTIDYDVTAYPE